MKPHLKDRINRPLSVYIFGYLFIWVGLTTLFYNKYGIVGAVAENVAWSNHLDVMYYKHPGLGALFIKIVSFVTFGNYILMASLASGLCVLASLIYMYKICRLYFSEEESALLVMATTFSGFYLFRYFLSYDQNIILLPFWVIGTYYFLLVKKSNMTKDWILLTIFTALGVYAKFEMLLLSAGMFVYIIFSFKKEYLSKLIFSAILFCILMIPAVIGIVEHNYSPILWAFVSGSGASHSLVKDNLIAKLVNAELHNILPIVYVLGAIVIVCFFLIVKKISFTNYKFLSNLKNPMVFSWLFPFIVFCLLQSYSGELPGGWTLVLMPLFLPALYKFLNLTQVKGINFKRLIIVLIVLQLIIFTSYSTAKYFNDIFLSDNVGAGPAIKADSFWSKYNKEPMLYTNDSFVAAFSKYKPHLIYNYQNVLPQNEKVLLFFNGCVTNYKGILPESTKVLEHECTSVNSIGKYHNKESQISLAIVENDNI